MRETILVPIDGSEESFKGLRRACELSKRLDAALHVLHVVAIPYLPETVFINLEPFISAGKDILKRAETTLSTQTCDDARYELIEGQGNPGNAIVKYAEDHDCSQIVMSARGHTPFTHLLLGSVSDYVIHHATCPVTIVR